MIKKWTSSNLLKLACSYLNVRFSLVMCVFDVDLELTPLFFLGENGGPRTNPTGSYIWEMGRIRFRGARCQTQLSEFFLGSLSSGERAQ